MRGIQDFTQQVYLTENSLKIARAFQFESRLVVYYMTEKVLNARTLICSWAISWSALSQSQRGNFPSDTINRTILSKWQVLFKSHCPFYLEQPPSADVFRVSLSQSTLLLTHQGKEAWDWPERCLPMSLHNIVVSLQLMTWFVMAHCMVFVLSLLVSLHGSGLLNV